MPPRPRVQRVTGFDGDSAGLLKAGQQDVRVLPQDLDRLVCGAVAGVGPGWCLLNLSLQAQKVANVANHGLELDAGGLCVATQAHAVVTESRRCNWLGTSSCLCAKAGRLQSILSSCP